MSVLEAIRHASWELKVSPKIQWFVADELEKDPKMQKELITMDGVIVPQGWGSRGSEGKIKAVQLVRENKIPYLGLCYGMQMAVIEFARNIAGLKDANSEEVDPNSKNQVIHIMEDQKKKIKKKQYGGTIRLGAWPCELKKGSLLEKMYIKFGNDLYREIPVVQERHRHRYEFNNEYREILEEKGLILSGLSPDGNLVEAVELSRKDHPFFIGTQYHPELKTRFLNPHPLFMGFIEACKRIENRQYELNTVPSNTNLSTLFMKVIKL